MLDDITPKEHPWYFSFYGALLVMIHAMSNTLFTPSNVGGKLSEGQLAVNGHRYSNKIVGAIHAIVLSFGAIRCGLSRGFDLYGEGVLDAPPFEHLTVGFMMVYLVYDTAYFFWRNFFLQPSLGVKEKWTFGDHTLALAHHLLGLLSWWLIYSGHGGVYWAQFIHMAEISTPVLNARWIMMKEGITSGPKYIATSASFLILFFLSRIPFTPVLIYHILKSADQFPSKSVAYFQCFVTLCFWILNLIWFSGGVKMALSVLTSGSKSKKA